MVRIAIASLLTVIATVHATGLYSASAEDVGIVQEKQFTAGQCLSSADCASNCCDQLDRRSGVCSGVRAPLQNRNAGCGSVDRNGRPFAGAGRADSGQQEQTQQKQDTSERNDELQRNRPQSNTDISNKTDDAVRNDGVAGGNNTSGALQGNGNNSTAPDGNSRSAKNGKKRPRKGSKNSAKKDIKMSKTGQAGHDRIMKSATSFNGTATSRKGKDGQDVKNEAKKDSKKDKNGRMGKRTIRKGRRDE
ncbi:hypothetical protein E4U43_003020 [Claviceps pusilla]|uniref:Uncharacterized protein n=1 Tax=Claviceps pusilla TaxID=123648 RepID=A0A9P7SVP3_9HYPO|nr:hypothetical protein E4U43_003020 [Claviceps pusilla]